MARKIFVYGVIKSCSICEELNYWEKHFIAALNCKAPYGYNITDGSEGLTGCTDKTRAKMSVAHTGKHHATASCSKMSKIKTSTHFSKATRVKISMTMRKSPFQNLLKELEAHQFSYRHLASLLFTFNLPTTPKNLSATV